MEQSQNHSDDNYVPDVVRRSYRLHSQSSASNLRLQGSEEWPEPPNDVPNQPYQTNVRKTEEVHVRIKQAEVIQVKSWQLLYSSPLKLNIFLSCFRWCLHLLSWASTTQLIITVLADSRWGNVAFISFLISSF